MNENQLQVVNWIRSGMDFNKGIQLLSGPLGKKNIALQYIGKHRSAEGKVAYEIIKAADLGDMRTWKVVIQDVQSGNEIRFLSPVLPKIQSPKLILPPSTETITTIETTETLETKPLESYPHLIRRIIHEYAELFQERSKLHTVMAEMPESNADAVCLKRAEIFDLIKSISWRLVLLYEAKTDFEKTGKLPDESEIYPLAAETKETTEITETIFMDEDAIKKQKKNLQSGNSKDQTILDYQSKERREVKTPMPNGPKRMKIEMRMADRNKRIEELDMMLLRPNAGKE